MNTLYAVARTVLLDALEALHEQRDAVVLVGAQAIYLHTADDPRAFEVRVAGPSALLVAKAHKISDRAQEPQAKRIADKDGLDVLRLLRGVESRRLADGLIRLRHESVSATVTDEAIALLAALFGSTDAVGTQMTIRATERLEDPRVIAESCRALTRELLSLVRS